MKHAQGEEAVPHTDGGQGENHEAPGGTGQGYTCTYEGKCVVSFRMLTWFPEWSPVVLRNAEQRDSHGGARRLDGVRCSVSIDGLDLIPSVIP